MQKFVSLNMIFSIVLLLSTFSIYINSSDLSYAQVYEYVDREENFSITIPPTWEVVPNPNTVTTSNVSNASSTSDELLYYDQNTAIAIKLKGISDLDFDKHTYITVTVRDLGSYLSLNETENNNINLSQVVDNRINRLETGLSDLIYYDLLNQNSTMTLGGEPAYQIQYITTLVPVNYFNVDTIAIHDGKLFDIYFNTGELMASQTLPDLNAILKSFQFIN